MARAEHYHLCILAEAPRGRTKVCIAPRAKLGSCISTDVRGSSADMRWMGYVPEFPGWKVVHYRYIGAVDDARRRAREMTEWPTPWMHRLIEEENPDWRDLESRIRDMLCRRPG